MYEVILSRRAERDLAGLDTAYRNAFLRKFLELRHWPDHHVDVRPLRGSLKGTYRMRIGPYRAILAVNADAERIDVLRIGDRTTVYN